MKRSLSILRVITALAAYILMVDARAEFAFRDGDTVVFLGDSITAARGYTKTVEHYTLMRFPERKVRFVNAGKGGDTASGCLERLERDVFAEGATVVTVALGVNDIGWGMKATAENKQRYLDGIRTIIERCRERNVRPIICSPAITAEVPDKAENGFLQKMADEGLALAQSLGVETVDIQRGMREVQRRVVAGNDKVTDPQKHVRLHVPDGVHLTDLGQLAMAYAMLKGLGAPQEVSTAVIDVETGTVVSLEACAVSEIAKVDGGIRFVRADNSLPLTLGAFAALDFRWVPVSEELSRYILALKNLPSGDYQIRAEGRLLGKVSAEQLARGINLSTMTADPWQPGGPWDAQSVAVKELVDARDKLWMSGRLSSLHLKSHPQLADLIRQNKALDHQLVVLQRALAKPQLYRFTVTKVERAADSEAAGKSSN